MSVDKRGELGHESKNRSTIGTQHEVWSEVYEVDGSRYCITTNWRSPKRRPAAIAPAAAR
jgi:hypothetical protein